MVMFTSVQWLTLLGTKFVRLQLGLGNLVSLGATLSTQVQLSINCTFFFSHVGDPLCDTDAKACQPQPDLGLQHTRTPRIIKNEWELLHETVDLVRTQL